MRGDLRHAAVSAARRNAARLAALSLLLGVGVALGAEPKEWLERMNHALTTRNYVGVFTHVRGTRAETLRIIHRVRGRDVSERLLSLDAAGREFIRKGDELTCYFPDKRTVLVERRAPDGPLLGALPAAITDSDSQNYEIRGGERERLLGRTTRVVALHPRDEYRYGYRLWIDEETSMPLKTQLCDQSGAVIEQILFSSIDLPDRIPDSMFKPQVDASNYQWLRADRRVVRNAVPPALWEAMRLPPGFRMATRSAQSLPGSSEPVEHVVYTDGIASVSVFVEPRKADSATTQGPARVGSSSAFSTVVDGHQVTVVGEVPPNTVMFIATQVKAAPVKNAAATQGLGLAPAPRRK
jgi:sigma-E factor negative regulatory protein RseB